MERLTQCLIDDDAKGEMLQISIPVPNRRIWGNPGDKRRVKSQGRVWALAFPISHAMKPVDLGEADRTPITECGFSLRRYMLLSTFLPLGIRQGDRNGS